MCLSAPSWNQFSPAGTPDTRPARSPARREDPSPAVAAIVPPTDDGSGWSAHDLGVESKRKRKGKVMAGVTYGASVAPDTQVIGRRVLATIIDVLLLGVVASLFTAPGALIDGWGSGQFSDAASGVLFSFGGLAALIVYFAYFTIMEGRYGQTLGKMALGIKVVRETDGRAPGTKAAVLRTLMRIVDSIGSYLVAFVVALVSDKHQRLGDMVAKTLVVRA